MKIKQTLIAFALIIGISGLFVNSPVYAQAGEKCGEVTLGEGQSCCDGVVTSVIGCSPGENGIWGILLLVINILTAGIGLVAVGGIIYGSILYTTAGGSMDQTKQAKKVILNVVVGIVAYALAYAFLSYLIPGGLVNVMVET